MTIIDQMGRHINLPHPPKRIISIVPSQTELLFYLGLENEVVGLTKFCVHPKEMWRSKPRVGGTKKLHFDKIAALQPDLIIGNKEENEKSQIEELEKHYPVWMSDIVTVDEALDMIQSIGKIVQKEEEANALLHQLKSFFNSKWSTATSRTERSGLKAAYFIWRNPWMIAASGTFINELMKVAGFENVFSHKTRYPEVTLEELEMAKPEVILLSSEPYPFKEKHIQEIREHCQGAVVKLVDGELFSWYGSRMLEAVPYFGKLQNEILMEIDK